MPTGEESLKISYKTLVRMMKYMAPQPGVYKSGLRSHTDKPVSALICEDQISGLEVEVNDSQWIELSNLSPSSFIFVVGDPLKGEFWKALSLASSPNLKVMMSGDKDRYSIAAFVIPNEGVIIKTPKECMDDQHPWLFKDFDFMDSFCFAFSDPAKLVDSGEQLQAFASLHPL
ncbi:putative 2-oxoglutarate-dependent dioxygenase AOP1 [Gossypium australe]|uniref:Putative 2-oxoglutarate-dependent dioxygenase AOP1 n=1 Tax=Gossypium australe TaxID=47621 RepID=A0A5B6WVR0_9ROSI|nr:putative 2-oxoglutarate-dependent dioxygenase AOP1 [Gossypium australe]